MNHTVKKSFFNEYEEYNEHGDELLSDVHEALQPIILKWVDCGYPCREISSLSIDAVNSLVAIITLRRALNLRKARRAVGEI